MKNLLLIVCSILIMESNALASRFGVTEPCSSGTDFPKILAKRGWEVVQIQSDTGYKPKLLHNQETPLCICDYFIPYTGDLQDTTKRLKDLDVSYIITGFEDAVCFTDQLNASLQLPSNGINKSLARRDKYLMHQAVQDYGLRVPQQIKISNGQEALVWKQANALSYPLVIKPLSSAGADGFFLVNSDEELIEKVHALIGTKDIFGKINHQLLVQEYVQGVEYIVNGVSADGHHYITDVWEYHKGPANGASIVDFSSKLLEYHEIDPDLIQYAKDVLTALEYRVGPSHMEIKIDHENRPILIEVGARLAGLYGHRVVQECMQNKKSQLEYTIDSYVEKENLQELKDGYNVAKKGLIACLISSTEGKIISINHLDEIRALPSFHKMELALSEGENILRTIDLHTSPGYIFLINEDEDQLTADYERIRIVEKTMFSVSNSP